MERCPVCRARLREESACPRCGADLAELRRIEAAARAWERRAAARLAQGDAAGCAEAAARALRLRPSPLAKALAGFARSVMQRDTPGGPGADGQGVAQSLSDDGLRSQPLQ